MAVKAYYLSNDLEFTASVVTAINETGVMIPWEYWGSETLDYLLIAIY